MSLLAELKRRKVFRVAVVYAATAFVILQAADIMLPRLGVPGWALSLVVMLVILGFPIALVLAWALELTPDGIKRTDGTAGEAGEAAVPPALLGKRTVLISALLVAVGVGLGAGWLLKPGESGPAESTTRVAETVAEQAADGVEAAASSIAVLPFLNMSIDPANEFFADGISEELLNILAGIEGLAVASRTSAFSFKGKDIPIPEIARQLGVRHILEGSVRRQDDRVRITAQLIETRSDTHLWSQTYERDLVDIFRVQEEIAQSITTALEDVLGLRRVSVEAPTADLEAYDHFLRGRTRFYERESLDQAIDDLESAVERDPAFAEAWGFLSAARYVVGIGGWWTERDRGALLDQAWPAAERALALDPGLSTALAVKGRGLLRGADPAQMAEGLRLLERAADGAKADTTPRMWLGLSWMDLGFVDRALPHLERALAEDPLVPINNGFLGVAYAAKGRWREGGRLTQRAVELVGQPYFSHLVAIGLANAGDRAGAQELLAAALPMLAGREIREFMTGALVGLEGPSPGTGFVPPTGLDAQIMADFTVLAGLMLQDAEQVFGGLGASWSDSSVVYSAWLPSLGWLREDPRFFELMRETGVLAFWEIEGFPPGCRPVDDPAGRRLDCSGYAP